MTVQSEKVEFPNFDNHRLQARLERPDGAVRAWALFAHCFTCSKDLAAASRIARALARRGVAVMRFDFTGLGESEGDFAETSFSSNLDDLVAAADFMRRELEEGPSFLIGHSLGGAACLAAADRIPGLQGVVTIGAPSDPSHVANLFRDKLDDIEDDGAAEVSIAGRQFRIRKQFVRDLHEHSGAVRMAEAHLPLLIFHSPADRVVDIEHAREIYEAARHPKSFISLDNADHLLTRAADAEYVAETLAAWASRYLPDAPADDAPEPAEGVVVVRDRNGGLLHDVYAGAHTLVADEPRAWGGTDQGPTPYDLLLAGLGACTAMTLRGYAERKEWPLGRVTISLQHDKIHAKDCEGCETSEGKVDRISRTLMLEGDLSESRRKRLLEIADRCPVHQTLVTETKIETTPA